MMRLERLFLWGMLAYDVSLFLTLSYCVVVGDINLLEYGVIATITVGLYVAICIELEKGEA